MAATNINVRVDIELNQSAEALKHQTPNAETKAAFAEYEEMKKNPGSYKRYSSFDDMVDEVIAGA